MQSLQMDGGAESQQDLRLVNERLEKAIEQLRQANESLKVTNRELYSLNHQLEMMNEEVEILSREVDRLKDGYVYTLDHVPYPALMADHKGKIEVWNAAAQQLFHLAPTASVGIDLSEIPVQRSLGRALSRQHREVVEHGDPLTLKDQVVRVKPAIHRMDVHFNALGRHRSGTGVLVIFKNSPTRDGIVSLWAAS